MWKKIGIISVAIFGTSTTIAQSRLNLYGSVDESLSHFSNLSGASRTGMEGGITEPNVFGLRGSEDMGGGLRAGFWLESGITLETGSLANPAVMFNRNASVSLEGAYGSISLGRQPDLTIMWLNKTSNGFLLKNSRTFHVGNLDNLAAQFQFNSSVRYMTPKWNGITAAALYGMSDSAINKPSNRNISFGVNYDEAPIRIAAVYSAHHNRTIAGFGPLLGMANIPATGALDQLKIMGIGATYSTKKFRFNSVYTRSKLEAASSSATAQSFDLGMAYHVTPLNTLNAGYTRSKLASTHWDTYSLMWMHYLSKRTQLYFAAAIQRASRSGLARLWATSGFSSSQTQNMLSIGFHHSF